MFKNWNFLKHTLMSVTISAIICLLSCFIFNPFNSSIIGLLFTSGRGMSLNINLFFVTVITSVTLILTLSSYIIIRRKLNYKKSH